MSATVNHVKIEGTEEMMKNLSKLSEELRGQAALEAVEEGANIIMSKAVMNAPFLTSALRNSFRVESRNTANGAEAEVGPHVAYDRIQELGGYTGRGHKTRIIGKFYLSRAVEETRGEVSSAMAKTIRDYLK